MEYNNMKEKSNIKFSFFPFYTHEQNEKKALSGAITAFLLILLALVLVGIIWGVVSNLVEGEISKTDCLDTIGKVSFNHGYTCYNGTSKELRFGVNIGDIVIDNVIVSVSGGGTQKNLELQKDGTTIANLRPLNGSYGDSVVLANRNEGTSYYYNITKAGFSEVSSLDLSPKIGENTCPLTDTISEIPPCYAID